MSQLIDVKDLANCLNEVLAKGDEGEEIILTDGNGPRARLIPLPVPQLKERIMGLHPGAMVPAPDFDDPFPEDFWFGGNVLMFHAEH